mgnify:CR=1 FL=1
MFTTSYALKIKELCDLFSSISVNVEDDKMVQICLGGLALRFSTMRIVVLTTRCKTLTFTHYLMVATTFLFRIFHSDSITSLGISFMSIGSSRSLIIISSSVLVFLFEELCGFRTTTPRTSRVWAISTKLCLHSHSPFLSWCIYL